MAIKLSNIELIIQDDTVNISIIYILIYETNFKQYHFSSFFNLIKLVKISTDQFQSGLPNPDRDLPSPIQSGASDWPKKRKLIQVKDQLSWLWSGQYT